MLIELAGRRVGGDVGIGAGHLALFFTDTAGDEFALSAYTDNNLISGNLYVETHEGSAWVPRHLSTEGRLPSDLFDRKPLDFGPRRPDDVAKVLDQYALAIDNQNIDYSALSRNSNSVIGSLLDMVGIDAQTVLPNPPDVGWLGFVAVDKLFTFEFEIQGSAGADYIQGRELGQIFDGRKGNDTLQGGAGADTLIGGSGDDLIDGGPDTDTAIFSGDQAGYTLTLGPAGTRVTDRHADGSGTDTLSSIEFLDFSNEVDVFNGNPMHLDIFDNPITLSPDVFSAIAELYIAYFNRAPDAIGLYYWASEVERGFSIQDMAANFFGQPETQMSYASMLDEGGTLTDVDGFVTSVYQNVLGRGPDQSGFD